MNPLITSLPLVATALTERTGINVEIGGTQAYTNGKCIHLPALPLDADNSLASVARGMLDHEAAHCLFTDMEQIGKGNAVERWLTNMLEDMRVEQCMADRYAGSAENLKAAALHVFSQGKEGDEAPELLPLNWSLLYMRAWQIPQLARQCQRFEKALEGSAPSLRAKMQPVLDEAKTQCASTEEARAYAVKLAAIIQGYSPPPDANASPEPSGDEQGQGESSADGSAKPSEAKPPQSQGSADTGPDPSQDSADGNSKTTPQTKEEQGEAEHGQSQSSADNSASPSPNTAEPQQAKPPYQSQSQEGSEEATHRPFSCLFNADADGESNLPLSMGERMAQELSENAQPRALDSLQVAKEVSPQFSEMPPSLKKEALCLVPPLRRYLVGKLQADTLEGVKPADAGRINTRKLYRASVQDAHVFLRRTPARLVQTAVHIMLDCSLSTNPILTFEMQSAFALAMALQNIRGVNVGLSAFPVEYPADYNGSPGVAWLIKHGQRAGRLFPMPNSYSTTPMDAAIFWATAHMRSLRERRKILLIFTDGEPDNQESTVEAVKQAEYSGIEVYGISYRASGISDVIPASTIIHDMRQLPSEMKKLLASTLHTRI